MCVEKPKERRRRRERKNQNMMMMILRMCLFVFFLFWSFSQEVKFKFPNLPKISKKNSFMLTRSHNKKLEIMGLSESKDDSQNDEQNQNNNGPMVLLHVYNLSPEYNRIAGTVGMVRHHTHFINVRIYARRSFEFREPITQE